MPEKAHASPTKQFFVNMITKDISVQDCILDLLDNSIDGARSVVRQRTAILDGTEAGRDAGGGVELKEGAGGGVELREGAADEANAQPPVERPPVAGTEYEDFAVDIEFDSDHFRISGNCGGISVNDALNYAFHFGRR